MERSLEFEEAIGALMFFSDVSHELSEETVGYIQAAADNSMLTPEESAKWDVYCEAHPWDEHLDEEE